jgi:hypothetical protein
MELLATNQPWNLLIFMAVPIILAETIAITELYLLFTRNSHTWVKMLSRISGGIAGVYFFGVTLYLLNAVVFPLTVSGEWRGIADIVAVSFYLFGVVPLGAITLLELGLIGAHYDEQKKMKWHALWVGVFLIVAHVAMIFGMLNPSILGYQAPDDKQSSHEMQM